MNTAKQPMYEWQDLPWKKIERTVFKLQKRIYQASQRGDWKTVHKLQRLLMNSWSARCLAVRRMTQDNRGKKTAGVDGVKALTPKQRLQLAQTLKLSQTACPVRRVWIPKPGKSEKRPLGIPTLRNRAEQALAKLALEPEWEARFEPNSYGFRPGRGAHDEIAALCNYLRISTIQIYSLIGSDDIVKLRDKVPCLKLIKALGVAGPVTIEYALELQQDADALLLDTFDADAKKLGGTGKTHDWNVSREIVLKANVPVILAGGLTEENAKEAINHVKPWGIDCETGVEKSDGFKNHEKLRRFIRICKTIN